MRDEGDLQDLLLDRVCNDENRVQRHTLIQRSKYRVEIAQTIKSAFFTLTHRFTSIIIWPDAVNYAEPGKVWSDNLVWSVSN